MKEISKKEATGPVEAGKSRRDWADGWFHSCELRLRAHNPLLPFVKRVTVVAHERYNLREGILRPEVTVFELTGL